MHCTCGAICIIKAHIAMSIVQNLTASSLNKISKELRSVIFVISLLWLRVENQDLICVSIAKQEHCYVCWMPLQPQHWWLPCQHCLSQCMLILISNWDLVQYLEVWCYGFVKFIIFCSPFFVQMVILLVMYGNFLLATYVFYIQMIEYWLSTP